MKLLTKYNRVNIITAVIILLATSVSFYIIIRTILLQQLDKDLKVEEQEIYEYVKENNALPNASVYKGQVIKFQLAKSNFIKRQIKTLSITNASNNEDEPARVLFFPVVVNGVLHKAIVIKSQVEAEDLLEVIVLVIGVIILLMLLIMSLINRFVLRKLWRPFYSALDALRTYNANNGKVLELPKTELDEFNELNASVFFMTKRISEEFETLRNFTDNASHEMQTPLAIITSKLDILLQTADAKQGEQLVGIYNATARLSKLNETLLLLAKINNDQYKNHGSLNLKQLLNKKLEQFRELIEARNIKISSEFEEVCISLNEELAEILINNLLVNAIKHNFDGGYINCQLNLTSLSISNSGPSLTFDEKDIFNRFQRSSFSTGTGLGLAVVQQICEKAGLKIKYYHNNQDHAFTIFSKEESRL